MPVYRNEDNLKYGGKDITLGSLVFCCSKDNEAYDRPLPEKIYKDNFIIKSKKVKVSVSYKRKVRT